MRKFALAVVLIAAVSQLGIAVAEACGDKALRIGRGVRFQRTTHPASVLIYIPSNPTRASQVQSLFKKVGHKSFAALQENNFNDALRSGQYEVVLSDLYVAASFGKQIENSPSRPVLIAVVSDGTKSEVAAAQKHYSHLVKNPHKADRYLDALEIAMRARARLISRKA
jgi:DNA-binding NtrC family response regulator